MMDDELEKDGQQLLELAGKNGRFQIISCIFIIGYSFIIFYNITTLPLQKIRPVAVCKLKEDVFESYRYCTEESYCNQQYDKQIIKEESINNWALDFNIDCEQEKNFDFITSSIFFGSLLSYVIMSVWADKYGRKMILEIEIYGMMMVIIIAFFSVNLNMICVLWFFYQFFNHVYCLLLVYSTEIMSQKLFSIICSMSGVCFPMMGFINSILFFYIKDWRIVHLIITIFGCVCTLIFKFIIIESPQYCLKKRDVKGFLKSLKKIASVNRTEEVIKQDLTEFEFKYLNDVSIQRKITGIKRAQDNLLLEKENGEEKIINDVSFMEYFRNDKTFRKEYLIVVFSFASVQLVFYGVLLNIEKFDHNVFLFSIVLYSSEITAEFLSGIFAQKYGRVIVLKYGFYVAGISFFLFQFSNNIFVTRIIFCSTGNFAIACCYNVIVIYMAEVFDIKIRSTASSYCRVPSQLVIIVSPYIISSLSYPFLLFAAVCMISGYLIQFTHETLDESEGGQSAVH